MKDTKRLDYLFSLSFQFRNMEFWKKLCVTDLYAFAYNGTVYYCSLTGKPEDVYGLNVYIGDDGLETFRRMHGNSGETIIRDRIFEWTKCQCRLGVEYYRESELQSMAAQKLKEYAQRNHITLNGTALYSQFVYYEPQYVMQMADEKQREVLIQALELSLYMAKEWKNGHFAALGLSEMESGSIPLYGRGDNGKWEWHAYSLPQMQKEHLYSGGTVDEEKIGTILALPKKKVTWVVQLFMSCYPVVGRMKGAAPAADPEEDPYTMQEVNGFFPYIFAIAIDGNRPMVRTNCIEQISRDMHIAVEKMAELMIKRKQRPYRVVVDSERDQVIVKKFCEDCGIKVEMNPDDADFGDIIKLKEEYVYGPLNIAKNNYLNDCYELNNTDTFLDESEQQKQEEQFGLQLIINNLRFRPEILDQMDEESLQIMMNNLSLFPEDVQKMLLRRMRKG